MGVDLEDCPPVLEYTSVSSTLGSNEYIPWWKEIVITNNDGTRICGQPGWQALALRGMPFPGSQTFRHFVWNRDWECEFENERKSFQKGHSIGNRMLKFAMLRKQRPELFNNILVILIHWHSGNSKFHICLKDVPVIWGHFCIYLPWSKYV